MNLHEELLQGRQANNVCRLCSFLKDLPPDQQAAWHAELILPVTVISHASIADYLKKHHSFVIQSEAIRRHRGNHEHTA
jgi:hypothetical protein